MSYLVVKKVKGRYYAYRQESYREGGKVRTRTIEYLGAIDPTLAGRIKSGKVTEVPRPTEPEIITITVTPVGAINNVAPVDTDAAAIKLSKLKNQHDKVLLEDKIQMTVNSEVMLVDRHSGEIVKSFGPVITTKDSNVPSRPFSESLKLPSLEDYGVSTTAIRGTHARYGKRLSELKINPSHMSDVKIEYGHPNGFCAKKDGSYSVVVSRRSNNKRHPVNKTELWKSYRQALSHSFIGAVELGQPQLYNDVRLAFDHHYRESQKLAFQAISLSTDPLTKLGLSLQLKLWGRLPAWVKEQASPEELGQINLNRQAGWRDEAAEVLAEVQKSGWEGMDKRVRDTRAKLKSRITKRLNVMSDASLLGKASLRFSGKRRRLFCEIREAEVKLQAVEQLEHRLRFLKEHLPH